MTSPFLILLHAHDRAWSRRCWSLPDRIDACALLWSLAVSVSGGAA